MTLKETWDLMLFSLETMKNLPATVMVGQSSIHLIDLAYQVYGCIVVKCTAAAAHSYKQIS